MQKPEANIVDEQTGAITDERVAALLEKGKVAKAAGMRSRKAKVKPPLLATVTHDGKKVEMRGVLNIDHGPKVPSPFDWYVKKYPLLNLPPDADDKVEKIGINKQFGPFTSSRAMIRGSTVYHNLRTARRKMRKARYRARVIGSILTRRSTPLVTKAEREAALVASN